MRHVRTIGIVVVVAIGAVVMLACSNVMDQYHDYIAEYRPDLYLYSDETYGIEVASGYREKDFAMDGLVGAKVDFVIITVVPKHGLQEGEIFDYQLKSGDSVYKGKMVVHPFKENYSAEIPERTYGEPIELILSSKGKQVGTYNMTVAATPQMLSSKRALAIATTQLKSQIASMTHNGRLNGEVYILFVNNPIDSNAGVYWYVAFVNRTNNTYALLIDPITEKVLARHV